jgi:hypothetical protein
MNIEKIIGLLNKATRVLVKHELPGRTFAPLSQAQKAQTDPPIVDVFFAAVAIVEPHATACKSELARLLRDYPGGIERGPSYVEVGGHLGDQKLALALFGLGEHLGFWRVLLPERLGIDDPTFGAQLARQGFLNIECTREWPPADSDEAES